MKTRQALVAKWKCPTSAADRETQIPLTRLCSRASVTPVQMRAPKHHLVIGCHTNVECRRFVGSTKLRQQFKVPGLTEASHNFDSSRTPRHPQRLLQHAPARCHTNVECRRLVGSPMLRQQFNLASLTEAGHNFDSPRTPRYPQRLLQHAPSRCHTNVECRRFVGSSMLRQQFNLASLTEASYNFDSSRTPRYPQRLLQHAPACCYTNVECRRLVGSPKLRQPPCATQKAASPALPLPTRAAA